MMIVVPLADTPPPLTVSCSVYKPLVEKLAVVASAVAVLNVTVPAPRTVDQVWVRVLSAGKPVAVPLKLAVDGRVMV